VLDSRLSAAEWPAFADVDEVSDMELIQGVSVVSQDMLVRASCRLPGCCPERLYHQNMSFLRFCGETKTQKKPGTRSGITHTKGCHELALYIRLLPPSLGILPHSLDTRGRRIHSASTVTCRARPGQWMTPFVIACECQASFRQRVFTLSEACACWLRTSSRSLRAKRHLRVSVALSIVTCGLP
jgi:hypothetical protein